MKTLISFLSLLLVSFSAWAQAPACAQIFETTTPGLTSFKSSLPERLLSYQKNETENLSVAAVQVLNAKVLIELEQDRPKGKLNRANALTLLEANQVLASIEKHPTLNPEANLVYEHSDREIGYCFGRATYYHLLLLRMGLQKDSIRKLWAVGPMKASPYSELTWGYHVTTIAFTKENGWMTIDPNEGKPLTVQRWTEINSWKSADKKLRFYVTEASKLSADLGDYNRTQLGLDLPRQEDWFKGYFKDMFTSMRGIDLKTLGVRDLVRESKEISK